jgi:hypothetical protein
MKLPAEPVNSLNQKSRKSKIQQLVFGTGIATRAFSLQFTSQKSAGFAGDFFHS